MNDEVSVLTLQDGKEYIVLEKVERGPHIYFILFEEGKPQNVSVAEYNMTASSLTTIVDKKLLTEITAEFIKRHPEYKVAD